ncbi:MAG: hypothetical protein ABI785_13245, partial [Gemmatimonadales bacterium]
MKLAGLCVLLLTALIGCTSPAATTSPSTPTETVGPSQATLTPLESLPPADFGQLPAPASLPAGDRDLAAQSLAQTLVGGSPAEVLPAMITAFLESGIPVVDDSGAQVAGNANGVAVQAWQVHMLAALDAGRRSGLMLSDLGEALTALDPSLGDESIADLLLADLHASATSDDPAARFWAQLIGALGRQRDGIDPLTVTDPAEVALDGLQLQLVLRRIASDIVTVSTAATGGGTLAAWMPPAVLSRAYQASSPPCTHSETKDLVVTLAENEISLAIGALAGYLDGKGLAGAGRLGNAVGNAQLVLDLAQFLMAYLLLEVDMTLDPPAPLVRTHKERPVTGAPHQVVATIGYDMGNAQVINCFRMSFATMGITFNVPQHGPLADTPVLWKGVDGFDARADRIVQF